ncbi:MAG: hypothetical protein IJI36_09135 [Kiritimatiellae bacterium]|nr:hypothetical protein [Kiritimatiellia bacterium]
MMRRIGVNIAVLMMAGCCVLPEAIPPRERKGQLYCYIRHAFCGVDEHSVHLVGWALKPLEFMFGNKNSGSWPNPGPIELLLALGLLPVAMIDPLVVTPTIDTMFLPYDLYQKHVWQPESNEKSNK